MIGTYCFSISAIAISVTQSDTHCYIDNSEKNFYTYFSKSNFFNTSHPTTNVTNPHIQPIPSFKKTYDGFRSVTVVIERLLETEFNQYSQFCRSLLVRHRKTDIIFPFHYFW